MGITPKADVREASNRVDAHRTDRPARCAGIVREAYEARPGLRHADGAGLPQVRRTGVEVPGVLQTGRHGRAHRRAFWNAGISVLVHKACTFASLSVKTV